MEGSFYACINYAFLLYSTFGFSQVFPQKKRPFFSFQGRDDLLTTGSFPRIRALVFSRTSQKDFPTFGDLSDARLLSILRLPWPKIPDPTAGLRRDID
jgi:hypothetical protein